MNSVLTNTVLGNYISESALTIPTPGDWLRLFDEEDVQSIILGLQADAELVEAIRSQPGWIVDFEDDEAVIFTSRATCATARM